MAIDRRIERSADRGVALYPAGYQCNHVVKYEAMPWLMKNSRKIFPGYVLMKYVGLNPVVVHGGARR